MDARDDTTYRVKVPWIDGRDCSTAETPVGFFICGYSRDGRPFLVGGESGKVEYFSSIAAAKTEALRVLEAKLKPCLEVAQSVRFSIPEPAFI